MNEETWKMLAAAAVALAQWLALQPGRPLVFAWFWHLAMTWLQGAARWLGRLGLEAEHSYYVAVEAGI